MLDLNNPSGDIRELALDCIGTLKPDGAFEIIQPFLVDSDPEVRGTAACNLGDIGDRRAVKPLLDSARNDPEEDVRSEALSALEKYWDYDILKCLIDEVYRQKKSRRPRQIVAKQLSKYDCKESIDALVYLLEDEDVYVRIFTVDSLFQLNKPRLRQVWEKVVDDESNYVSQVAVKAIAQLDSTNF